MKKKIEIDDEIDLIEVLEICWHGKYKIIFSIVFFILLTYGFLQTKKPNDKYFEAITILKPISSFVEDKYDDFNYLVKSESKIIDLNLMSKRSTLMTLENFETDNREKNTQTSSVFMINKKLLMYLFIEKLEDGRIFENAIKKFKILNKEDYGSSQQYQEAINKLKSSILIKKISSNKIDKVDVDGVNNWKIVFRTNNTDTWSNLLLYCELEANEFVRKHLIENFEVTMNMIKKKRSFELEDIEVAILNSKADYKKEIQNRLFYLREQLEIARELNIAKNTLLTQTYNTTGGIIASITTENNETAYYLRGYEMIEKEIELISNRKIDSPFVSNLVKLEKHKRDLLQSKNLERIQSAFLNSPIYNADFYAGKILTKSTNYKKINRKKPITPMLIVAGVFGAIFGFFYVLIASSIKQRYKS